MRTGWNAEQQNLSMKECIDYFRSIKVFDKLLRGFREKYISYGNFSGKVTLYHLSMEELEELEGFLQRNFHGQNSVSVSAAQFKHALENSRFSDIKPEHLLQWYFQEELVGKREQRCWDEECRKEVVAQFQKIYTAEPEGSFLHDLMDAMKKSPEGRVITRVRQFLVRQYRESGNSMEEWKRMITLSVEALHHLPYRQGEKEYLAVFAAMVTGNPHAFDHGTKEGQLLYLIIQWEAERHGIKVRKSEVFPAIQKQWMYLAAGILLDDISNYAMLSGVCAWKKGGNVHEGMDGFAHEGDMVQVPLHVIADWEKISCPEKRIFIVENPSVYAMLCRKWKGKRAYMCMNGQPRLSSVLVLDLLAAAEIEVYYAGDFDPEGLLIAQKIRQYYRGKVFYWHMSEEVYERSKSREQISERRLKMLDRISDEELKKTALAIAKCGMAGYQENVWKIYLEQE